MVFSDERTICTALMYLSRVVQMSVDVIILQFSNRSDFWTRINHHSACNNARTAQWLFKISSSHGGEYDVQSCLLGYTAV
jgi:hypothetical protein